MILDVELRFVERKVIEPISGSMFVKSETKTLLQMRKLVGALAADGERVYAPIWEQGWTEWADVPLEQE